MHYHEETRISHAQWRRLVKREQRRHRRQKLATLREEDLLAATQNLNYQNQLFAEQTALQQQDELEQLRHQQRKAEWQARDLAIHALFLHNKKVKEQRERKEREQQELIQKEWECKQKQEEKAKKSEETSLKVCWLLCLHISDMLHQASVLASLRLTDIVFDNEFEARISSSIHVFHEW